jgi:hypothetical protein
VANEWVRGTVSLVPNVPPNHTITNALNAIQSMLIAGGWELASWTPGGNDRYFLRSDRATRERWRYEGDGPTQNCGIHLYTNTPTDTEIRISCFLENTAGTAVQVDTLTAAESVNRRGRLTINWDVTAPNNYLMIAGEDGFYIEAGRDSSNTNLGHGMIVTAAEIPELSATKTTQSRWVTQGYPMDLFGECRFTSNRQLRFVTNDGTARNFSSHLSLYTARGVTSTTVAPVPADFPIYFFGNRDLILGQTGSGGTTSEYRYGCTFGQLNSPEDGRYRINPLLMIHETSASDISNRGASSASTSNTVAVGTGSINIIFRDIRHDRLIQRVVAVDYTLLPFANLTEAETGKVYRVAEHNDNGRTANIGIEWPTTVVTPSLV